MKQEEQYTQEAQDKLEAELHYEQSPFMKWLDNFWYHYKWRTIIITFFVVVLAIVVVQMINRPKYDVTLVCACNYRMNATEHPAYEKAIEKFIPEDYDGDGEMSANIIVYEIFSDAEYAEAASLAEANSEEFAINPTYNADELQNFSQYSMMGESYVFLVSEHLYRQLCDNKRLRPLSELYGSDPLPEGTTEDGYGVYINQTDFYRYTPDVRVLPEDMVLCILRKAEYKDSESDLEKYARYEAFFRSIADYKVKE